MCSVSYRRSTAVVLGQHCMQARGAQVLIKHRSRWPLSRREVMPPRAWRPLEGLPRDATRFKWEEGAQERPQARSPHSRRIAHDEPKTTSAGTRQTRESNVTKLTRRMA